MYKENCALKLVDEIILYYDARSKKHQIRNSVIFIANYNYNDQIENNEMCGVDETFNVLHSVL